eukprot:2850024-Rhodomonas_salina.2
MRVRGYLNEKSVLEIFAIRPRPSPVTGGFPANPIKSRALALQYKVSNKTVRDIWKRKSWLKLTEPFCDESQEGSSSSAVHVSAQANEPPSLSDPSDEGGVSDVASEIDEDCTDEVPGVVNVTTSTPWLLNYIETLPSLHHEDPFQGDWLSALTSILLGTTVPSATRNE